ncbi:DJ-1/PfpI family protein [Mucilaginibacter pocheonensis]|uniref:Transcriptional regulator GlxA family with amidase domain n=1 Tax=Mucilaginibacter pocheonensis TaxID=398050 RepID=A0ABU1TEF6_9SPHI|nr:DJ-1/PfpI family protein [Mucilaginibacter pocheonensis]MDR6943768.1 transcriptional regulator GlxA family with amidase domain [Mucilaginibacter pocheonensis]
MKSSRRSFISTTIAGATAVSLSPLLGIAKHFTHQHGYHDGKLRLGMVVFDGFQLLDVFGPLEMFGGLRDKISIFLISEKKGVIKSSAGPAVVTDFSFDDVPLLEIVMIPGGGGTRREVNNEPFVNAFKNLVEKTPHVASICTGAAVLAKTGALDGLKATTNKRAFKWATSQGPQVNWVKQARWVEDGKFFTSSGISAGTDMALALIERLYGHDTAINIANGAEYEWNQDPHHDPFAELNGLKD